MRASPLVLLLVMLPVACGGRSGLGDIGSAPVEAPPPPPPVPSAPCPTRCAGPACCMISPHFGSAGADVSGRSIVADAATGDVVVAGEYTGAPDVGAGPLPDNTVSEDGLFVARYDAGGHARWAKGFPGALPDWMAFAGADLVVGGRVSGDVDFGCGVVHGGEISWALMMKLRGSDGSCLWSRAFVGSAADALAGAVDAAGDVLVESAGSVCDPGMGSPLMTTVKLSGSDGSCVWSRGAGGSITATPTGLAVDASGGVYVAGSFMGSMTFAGGMLTSTGDGGDALLLAYDGAGAERWARHWAGPAVEVDAGSVAVTSDGSAWVEGLYRGTIAIGDQTFGPAPGDLGAPFVAGFTPDGEPAGAMAFTGGDVLSPPLLAADPSGALLVSAYYDGALALGGQEVTAAGTLGTLFAELDTHASLAPKWVRAFDGAGWSGLSLGGLRFDPCGDILVTGGFDAAANDVGCGPMSVTQGPEVNANLFFARLGP